MASITPVFIVCSSRPRTGKTLLARLLVEYFKVEDRRVQAFDANPDNFTLVDFLPADTAVATLNDVRGEMALFDQLIAPDQVPKVVDLEPALFDRFFSIVQEIDLLREAERNGIAMVALFLADNDRRSAHGFKVLQQRLPGLPLIPVFNEALTGMWRCRETFPKPLDDAPALTMAPVSAVLRNVIERHSFSFASFLLNAEDQTSELFGWARDLFVQFREIELRMLLAQMKPSDIVGR